MNHKKKVTKLTSSSDFKTLAETLTQIQWQSIPALITTIKIINLS